MINLYDLSVNFASKAHNEHIKKMLKCYVNSHLTNTPKVNILLVLKQRNKVVSQNLII